MRKISAIGVILAVVVAMAVSAVAQGLNVTGKWTFDVQTGQGGGQPTVTFKQDGEKLTGTYTGRYGTFPFKGTLKAREIEFSFQMDTDGGQTTMSFIGEVAADAQMMKGTGTIEGLGDVTWSAKRDKS